MAEYKLEGIYYFMDKDGGKPVKAFIHSLTWKEQAKVYAYITELKIHGNNLRRPMADYIGDGIYELRPKDNRIFYFFYLRNKAVLVHAIRKYVNKIPLGDLNVCSKRKREVEIDGDNIEKLER